MFLLYFVRTLNQFKLLIACARSAVPKLAHDAMQVHNQWNGLRGAIPSG